MRSVTFTFWQRVPCRRARDSECPTAVCVPPMWRDRQFPTQQVCVQQS